MTRRHRNVLLITADQWRGDCLSAVGHPVVRSPNLDALAGEGVLFEQHYANAVPCGPSRACLHTGMYLHNHRSGTNGTPLDRRFTNWALEARRAGYDPALFGYTHTAPDPRYLTADDPRLNTDEGILPGIKPVVDMATHCGPWRDWLKQFGYALPEDHGTTYGLRAADHADPAVPRPSVFAPM
jgi:arylsulfatase A-like enzyme